MSKKLEDSMGELTCLKEEKYGYMLNNQSLLQKVKKLEIKNTELQEHLFEMMVLKSGLHSMREDLSAIERKLSNVLSKYLEFIHNVKTMMKSFLEIGGTPDFSALFPGGVISRKPKTM